MRFRRLNSFLLPAVFLAVSCSNASNNLEADTRDVTEPQDLVEKAAADSAEISDLANSDTDIRSEVPDIAHDTLETGPLEIPFQFFPVLSMDADTEIILEARGGAPPYSNWKLVEGQLPPGLSLDPDSGILSGVPEGKGIWPFVVQVSDAQQAQAQQFLGIRTGDAEEDGPLLSRATSYQTIYEARHLWHAMAYGLKYPDDPAGQYGLTTLGDTTFVSGNCTMAMAYRHAVVGTPESEDVVRQHVEGWRFFESLTGVPGLLGRSYGRIDDPWEDDHWTCWHPECDNHQGLGEFEGWIWRGDVSRDQTAGAVLGLGAVVDVVDNPQLKELAAGFLTNLADHLWENDLCLVDSDGEPTKYGDLDGEYLEGWPIPNGLNAVMALSWFKLAATVSDDPKYQEYYEELVYERNYPGIIQENMWVYAGFGTKWYNTYMAYEGFFHLMRLEEDPLLRERYKDLFRRTLWLVNDDPVGNRGGKHEWNPVKTTWYLFSTGEEDPIELYHGTWMLRDFPDAPLRDRKVVNSEDPTIEKNPDEPTEALHPIPISKRVPDMVMWHRGPYKLDGGQDTGEERTGCDYLLPYWMGRYYGFIGENW